MSFFLTIFAGPARDNKAPHLLLQRRLRALPLSRDFFHRGREENATPHLMTPNRSCHILLCPHELYPYLFISGMEKLRVPYHAAMLPYCHAAMPSSDIFPHIPTFQPVHTISRAPGPPGPPGPPSKPSPRCTWQGSFDPHRQPHRLAAAGRPRQGAVVARSLGEERR